MGELTLRGDYRVIRPVGKGSYGEVILVQHLEQGRKFVIKKLKLQNASRRERKAAEQEAQLLSRLKHPNIVAYRESWEGEDGMLYIVMGFCEGGDLYHKLKEQKGKLLPECQVMDWFIQIAMALQYLHEEHVMHRDLKTQNIFLTRSNIIKVGDLGIARVLESQNDMASTLIGTPYYMSPELFSNKPYNYKSDVWALGCCVYEMTTLKHAFNAKDMNSLVFRIIEGKLPPMTKNYSEDLGELIRKMLSQQPEKRPSVKQILRKPFIKHHIALFLQATKQNHCKHKKKIPNSSTSNINGNGDPHGLPSVQRLDCDLAQRPVKKKEKDIMKKKPVDTPPDAAHRSLNHTGTSVATLSNVDINFCPAEKNLSSHPIPTAETPDRITKEPGRSVAEIRSHTAHDRNSRSAPLHLTNSMAECVGTMELPSNEDLDSTEKLLEPFVPVMVLDIESPKATCPVPHSSLSEPSLSRQRRHQDQDVDSQLEMECPRPSPSPPAAEHKATNPVHREMEKQDSLEQIQSFEFRQRVNSQDQRPLSARERRRLKQSQEDIFTSGPANRRDSSHSVGMDSNWPRSLQASDENKEHFVQRLSEDELSSSTSSTDRSEGDYKDRHRKSDSSEMQDLVQLMTQTLHMGKDQSENAAAQCNEFKMHRKYRDTLVLHGKAAEEPDGFHFHHFPSDNVTVPEKFRRMVESLRADVVQGVGVKVLERVYDIMEREDETDRELQLKNHLGDKYDPYGLKIQQLKFFEDNSKF